MGGINRGDQASQGWGALIRVIRRARDGGIDRGDRDGGH